MTRLLELNDVTYNAQEAKLHYAALDCADEAAAHALALAGSPATFQGLPRKKPQVEITKLGEYDFDCRVNYGLPESQDKQAGDMDFSFEIGTQTAKITHSIKNIASYSLACLAAPDHGGAIGVGEPGKDPEGCDIIVPTGSFQERWYLASLSSAYKRTLMTSTGKVNSAPWRGYLAGEVLFVGASGSKKNQDQPWEITYKFQVSETRRNFKVGVITVTEKRGWDYLWCQYRSAVADGKWVKQVVGVYIEQVYEEMLFTTLGIG